MMHRSLILVVIVLLWHTMLYSTSIDETTYVEVTYTVVEEEALTSLGDYAQIVLVILTSLVGVFFLRKELDDDSHSP